jgi:putative antitoxin of VapBC-like toxin-antitoxin system
VYELTSVAVDAKLLQEAHEVGRHRPKRETLTAALQEYLRHHRQLDILTLFGKIDYDPSYDYRRECKGKPA